MDWYSDEIWIPFFWSRLNRQSALILLLFSRTKNNTKPKTLEQKMKRENYIVTQWIYTRNFDINSKYRAYISRKCLYRFLLLNSKNWLFKLSQQISEHMPLRCCRVRTRALALLLTEYQAKCTRASAHMDAPSRIYKIFKMIGSEPKKYALAQQSLCLTHNGLPKVFFRAFVTKQIIKWTTVKWARARSTNKQLSKIRTKTTTTIIYTHVTC